jgi:hypothetical protein
MEKQTIHTVINEMGICRYHCTIIPTINGIKSRKNGAFFHMGIELIAFITVDSKWNLQL